MAVLVAAICFSYSFPEIKRDIRCLDVLVRAIWTLLGLRKRIPGRVVVLCGGTKSHSISRAFVNQCCAVKRCFVDVTEAKHLLHRAVTLLLVDSRRGSAAAI